MAFEILFQYGHSKKPLTVTKSSLTRKIDQHLNDLGLKLGEHVVQIYSKKWETFIDASLEEVKADDIITVTERTSVSYSKSRVIVKVGCRHTEYMHTFVLHVLRVELSLAMQLFFSNGAVINNSYNFTLIDQKTIIKSG